MRAVLLFSALMHIVAVGALAAFALRGWLNVNRPREPTTPEFVGAATVLGLAVAVVGTLIAWLGRGFESALTTGLAAGLLSALAFMLALGVMPQARPDPAAPPSYYARMAALGLVAAVVLTEVIAFTFLVATASRVAPYS